MTNSRKINVRQFDVGLNQMVKETTSSLQIIHFLTLGQAGVKWLLASDLLDRNGERIWEGDLLEGRDNLYYYVKWVGAGLYLKPIGFSNLIPLEKKIARKLTRKGCIYAR